MKIHFDGAAQTVTGSQYLLEVNGCRLLLECGLYQGKRSLSYERNLTFPFNPKKIDEGVLIDLPLSRQDLAEMTGTTLFTVSRVLKNWENRGLIQSQRQKVMITSPHGMVVIAEDLPEDFIETQITVDDLCDL